MWQSLKRRAAHFLRTPPGRRFESVYRRRRERPGGGRPALLIGGGLLLLAIGLVLLFLPGPGLLFALAGLILLAGESLPLARVLDRFDRALHRWLKRRR